MLMQIVLHGIHGNNIFYTKERKCLARYLSWHVLRKVDLCNQGDGATIQFSRGIVRLRLLVGKHRQFKSEQTEDGLLLNEVHRHSFIKIGTSSKTKKIVGFTELECHRLLTLFSFVCLFLYLKNKL